MIACELSIGSDDGEGCDRFDHRWFTARREMGQCEECPALIRTGERYQRISFKLDDHRKRYRLCATCAEIADAFCEFHMVGSLWESIEEAFEETPITTGCYQKLSSAAAKRKFQATWIHWKGLGQHGETISA